MRIAVTGADGFLGWHVRCALKARGDEIVTVGRRVTAESSELDMAVKGVDAVLHLAGVNRADDSALRTENLSLAQEITASLDRTGGRPALVYANSIQSGNGTAFGDGKQAAAEHLSSWGAANGAAVTDVRLPNLFGEHGRPHYNSVVATFCYELSRGRLPRVDEDREIPLLHVQDAVSEMLAMAERAHSGAVMPQGRPTAISTLLIGLTEFKDLYAMGDIPDIADSFDLALFNTYRSFCFPDLFPIYPTLRTDDRGHLFECVRGHGGQAQVFCSTSLRGTTRGEHFHLRKVERFLVLHGTAEIMLRRLFDNAIVRFSVSGERPAMIDMPTMWAHSITNTGSGELMTMFWAHEILNLQNPDTYPEPVQGASGA